MVFILEMEEGVEIRSYNFIGEDKVEENSIVLSRLVMSALMTLQLDFNEFLRVKVISLHPLLPLRRLVETCRNLQRLAEVPGGLLEAPGST